MPYTATGLATTTPERVVSFVRNQPSTAIASGLPYGAPVWAQPYDPSDHLPFVVNFAALLDTDEAIISVEQLTLSAQAAFLGITIDVASGFAPIIDSATLQRVQFWLLVSSITSPLFDASGVPIGISTKVKTSATAVRTLERTAIATVRQL